MPRFSANLSTLFTDAPFPARFARAAAAGFTAVEFQFPYEHDARTLAGLLKDHGLTCVMFNMPPGKPGEKGLAALPGRRQEFRDSVTRALDYATGLGATGLHAMAGIAPASSAEHRNTYQENLAFAADQLAIQGRTLLIEPISQASIPGYFLSEMHHAALVCADIGAANLGIQMDFYHTHMSEGRPAARFQEHAASIRHVQISNVPGRHEPDAGEIDYAPIFKIIDASGYAGWIGCEYTPRGRTEDSLGWMKTLIA